MLNLSIPDEEVVVVPDTDPTTFFQVFVGFFESIGKFLAYIFTFGKLGSIE